MKAFIRLRAAFCLAPSEGRIAKKVSHLVSQVDKGLWFVVHPLKSTRDCFSSAPQLSST